MGDGGEWGEEGVGTVVVVCVWSGVCEDVGPLFGR